jgi:asparagine synthase (glutamine-hydrolysing)
MDCTVVRSLVQEHLDGKQNRRLLIWSLLNVDEWCKQYLQWQAPVTEQLREPVSAK